MPPAGELEAADTKGLIRVFVYGSLKAPHGNNTLLKAARSKFVGYDSITGDFEMVSLGGFPGVVRIDEGSVNDSTLRTIRGEVWATNEAGLVSLDCLEGHPNWYERQRYTTDIMDLRCWMYTFPPDQRYSDREHYPLVKDSLWRPGPAELAFWKSYGDTHA